MSKSTTKPIKLAFDASPLLVNKTGVAYYTERLMVQLAEMYPDQLEITGFYYNFLGKRSATHFPQRKNLHYKAVRFIPSKIIYQLRRWGVQIPVEFLSGLHADFILYPNFLGYPSLRHTPSANVVHDLTYVDLPQYVARKNQHDLEHYVPETIQRASFVVTVSNFSKQKIVERYQVPTDKVVVTPIPPDSPTIYTKSEQEAILDGLGIHQPFILFLGTIEPRKNIGQLVAAYRQLSPALRKKYALVVAGRVGWNCDEDMAALTSAQQEGYNIIRVGYVDEEARAVLYQTTSLFTIASHYEGFGMIVLEAMSYGAPCAVSDIEVFHEVGKNAAAYFDQSDPSSIATTISDLLQNDSKRKKLAQAGQQLSQTYNWRVIAGKLFAAIQRALAEHA